MIFLHGRDFRTAGEPLSVSPGLQHGLGIGVALVGQFLHVVEEIEHQQGFFQGISGNAAQRGVAQEVDQRLDVEAAQHGAQQFGGLLAGNQRGSSFATGDGGQERGLDLGGVIHTSRHAVGQQVHQHGFFASRRGFQQLDQFGGLLGVQGQRGDSDFGTFCDMLTISF